MFDALAQDLRYAIRSLIRRPLFAVVAIASLALGIGINTAIFSVFERLLLRPLPVPSPEEIVLITSPGFRHSNVSTDAAGGREHVFSEPLFRDLERLQNTGLSGMAAHRDFAANIAYGGRTERTDGLIVSGGYFATLGVTPAMGRVLTPSDDRVPGGHPVVVLANRFWRTQFGGDPQVVGRTIAVNGVSMTIVGVAADGFRGNVALDAPALFAPLAMREPLRAGGGARTDHWLYVFGRLAPGAARAQVETAMNGPFSVLIRDVEYPAQSSGIRGGARDEFLKRRIVLEDGTRSRNADRGEAQVILTLLLSITGLVLLIACANLANLLLARAADRAAEMSVRVSVGASSWRVLRLLITEAAVIGILGAALGLVVASLASRGMMALMPVDDAAQLGFEVNGTVLMFTLLLGVATSGLFGLFPAAHSVRAARGRGVTRQARGVSHGRSAARFRTGLAAAQIALATALVAQAGLFVSSLRNVARTELGIQPEGLMTFRLAPYLNGYTPERAQALADRLHEELGALPGVVSVGASTVPLLADSNSGNRITVEGFDPGPDGVARSSTARTSPGYFRTVGIPLLAGRDFTSADAAGRPKVAIVNEAFARTFNLGSDPVGRRMALGAANPTLDIEIVGLVRDARYDDLHEVAPPQFFLPYSQHGFGALTFYVRSTGDPRPLRSVITSTVARADANLPVERLWTMQEQIWDNSTRDRVLATLTSWFAAAAALLAGIGLYAVLAYAIAQRWREIGVRMALGATVWDVRRLVLGHVGNIAVIGGAIGVAAALALGRLGRSLLIGVDPASPAIMAVTVGAVMLLVTAAALVPARRAARIDPAHALRAD